MRLFDQRRYEAAFLLAALTPALGFAAWDWINRRSGASTIAAIATKLT